MQAKKNRNVYGRKKRVASGNNLATRVFSANSSSLSPSPVSNDVKSLDCTAGEYNDMENTLREFKSLSLQEDESAKKESQSRLTTERQPLKWRDLNAGVSADKSVQARKRPATAKTKDEDDERELPSDDHRRGKQTQSNIDKIPLPHHSSPISVHHDEIATVRHSRRRRAVRNTPASSPNADLVTHAQPLLDLCRDRNASKTLTSFQKWADSIDQFFHIVKIAEASYGEVYRLCLRNSKSGLTKADESVLKLIALKPPPNPVMAEGKRRKESAKVAAMSAVRDVASEVRLLQRMSSVPGFTNFREVRVMRGRLPTQFVKAWREWNSNVKESFFPDPGKKTTHNENQLWAVVEMQDAGTDLEVAKCENICMVWDAFWGVAVALAKGEEWARFEHRDLHLGNICVRLPPSKARTPPSPTRKLGFTGLETTIIDYTLSRADMSPLTDSCGSPRSSPTERGNTTSAPGEVAHFDLTQDSEIFQGDADEDYQYEVYRHMRSAVLHGDACADTTFPASNPRKSRKAAAGAPDAKNKDNDASEAERWRQYHPLTNLVWLHFVLTKLVEQIATQPVNAQNAMHELSEELERRMQALQGMMTLKSLHETGFGSAAGLVAWAVEQGWLDERDVCG